MTISMDKAYQTRDGRKVRIYAVDGESCSAVHGAYWSDTFWSLGAWDGDGSWLPGAKLKHSKDLIEARPRIKRDVWINVYGDGSPFLFSVRRLADSSAPSSNRIACVKFTIDVEEGHGLDGDPS